MRYKDVILFIDRHSRTIPEFHFTKFLVLLLLTDIIFIFFHVIHSFDIVKNPLLLTTRDGSYSEVFQYTKELWIVVLIIYIGIKRSYSVYFCWSLLFVYLLLDDSLRIHERGGDFIASFFSLTPAFGLKGDDFGELIVSLFFGFFLFSLIYLTSIRSDKFAKQTSMFLFILVIVLAFFGVVVDLLHAMIATNWKVSRAAFGLVEDGGEMIVMSLIAGFVYPLSNDLLFFNKDSFEKYYPSQWRD